MTLDDGTAVVKDAEVAIAPGERVLVAGESGTGKSTLVRAISGLWPWGEGTVQVQKGAKMFLMPQQAYVPTGTLHRAATYPAPPEEKSEGRVAQGVSWSASRISPIASRRKRPGIRPCPAAKSSDCVRAHHAARARHHRARRGDLGARSASQDKLMKLLTDELKATTIVSVGHRPELEQFHDRKITLERRRGGAKLVTDVELIARPGRAPLLRRLLRPRTANRRWAKSPQCRGAAPAG